MKITEYARRVGVTPLTARKWFHAGAIEGAYQMPSGTIIVPDSIPDEIEATTRTVVYARVSSADQRKDLGSQAERLTKYCVSNGWGVDAVVKEVGSGMNDKRPKLMKLLSDETVSRIVVEHKDRLTRFGFNYIATLLSQRGTTIVVVNEVDDDGADIVADFVAVITSFCARIYGSRRGKRKTEKLTQELVDATD